MSKKRRNYTYFRKLRESKHIRVIERIKMERNHQKAISEEQSTNTTNLINKSENNSSPYNDIPLGWGKDEMDF